MQVFILFLSEMDVKGLKPPGPKGKFFWGSTLDFAKSTLGFIEECRQEFPEIAYAKIAFRDFYILFKPEFIQHVLQKNHKNYVKSFAYDGLKDFLGEGLLTGEGEQWLKQRRLAQPAFHRKSLAKLQGEILTETLHFLEGWEAGEEINLQAEMLDLTQRIITRALFGGDGAKTPGSDRFLEILGILRKHANDKMKNPLKAPLWVPNSANRKFKQARKDLESTVFSIIRERVNKGIEGDDLLGMLMSARDAETGASMSERELYDEIATIYVAGQETTTNALSFLFYLLAHNPSSKEKIENEVDASYTGMDTDLSQLNFIRNCIQESMRLYPPAWALSRTAVNSDDIGGFHVPAKATVFLSIYAMHRNPEYWNGPDSFHPERFEIDYPKQAYLPFGFGPRLCIGNHFAMMEMQLIVAAIAQRFQLELIGPETLELITPITLNPKEALRFRLRTR